MDKSQTAISKLQTKMMAAILPNNDDYHCKQIGIFLCHGEKRSGVAIPGTWERSLEILRSLQKRARPRQQ